MRLEIALVAICALCAAGESFPSSNEATRLELKFNGELKPWTRSIPLSDAEWKYVVTSPDDTGKTERGKDVVRYIEPAPNKDTNACRLQSRRNFVTMMRTVGSAFADAKTLSWEWSVARHPNGGRLGGAPHPNDQSIGVYLLFRKPKPDIMAPDPERLKDFEYSGLAFVWEHKKGEEKPFQGQMPWPESPRALIHCQSLRVGETKAVYQEKVELKEVYKAKFKTAPPSLWAVVLLADSNEVEAEAEEKEMTTDATVRAISLQK